MIGGNGEQQRRGSILAAMSDAAWLVTVLLVRGPSGPAPSGSCFAQSFPFLINGLCINRDACRAHLRARNPPASGCFGAKQTRVGARHLSLSF